MVAGLLPCALVCAVALTPAAAAAQADPSPDTARAAVPSVHLLAWLAGCWEGTLSNGAAYEEMWLPPRGGVLLGMARMTRNGRTLSFEFIRVSEQEGTLVYAAQPSGRPPTLFRATAVGHGDVTFENPEHDFPQRIRYRVDGEAGLHARIEGEREGEVRAIDFPLRRVACPGSDPHVVGAQTLTGTTAAGLHYVVDGSGEPVVFIHAFSLDGRMWGPQVAAFRDRVQVIRYDLRGHGRSVPPTEPYTSHDDLRDLLDELGIERATLVGLSAGAEVALNFAIVHPDRVRRLVLAAPGLGGYATPSLPWLSPVFEAAAAGDPERAARLWAATPIMALRANPDAAEKVASLVMANQRLWTYRRTEQPLAPPAIDRLAAITCPALVIVGDQDLPHILDIAGILETRAGAAVKMVPGAGHIVNLDAPAAFNDAVRAFIEAPDAP